MPAVTFRVNENPCLPTAVHATSDKRRYACAERSPPKEAIDLAGIEAGTLVVHTQDPADVKIVGEAGVYSAMNSGGNLDVSGLHYERYDEDVIQSVILDQ